MNKENIYIGIIGGAGYTGGELVRLLINHPNAEIVFVQSKSNAGNFISDVHTDLLGDMALKFTDFISQDIDVLFLCAGHGDAKKFLEINLLEDHIRIIDLSQDFRLTSNSQFTNRNFIYGLPELNRDAIRSAKNIANPGCFATAIQLGLLPLASEGLIKNEVHIHATTGSTGAGQSLSATSHFTWRNNNLSVYKAFEHQHLAEIKESLIQLQKNLVPQLNFIPQRGSFTRGIFASMYTNCNLSLEEVYEFYGNFYLNHPFTYISTKNIDLKQVINTNKCLIHLERHEDKLFIVSMIDNLLKGASGQAVQNMNLMFGLEETTGLKLKASAF
ncbi:MAG: N-acetyl-gamma-glutamyl-phosphate reductase [Daejeonella sp.]